MGPTRPLNVLLLGVQGSGKGTQAQRIAKEHGLAHIATGDMLRSAIAADTELGRRVKPILESGELVPDDLMIELIRERLQQDDAQQGFVLDGFPRTMPQAEALDSMLTEIDRPLSVVFELQVPDKVAIERLRLRAEGEGRADDTPEAIAKRVDLYHRETEPLVGHYRLAGNLIGIHGDRPENEVFGEIEQALEQVGVR
ncbi:MAG: adenylate kinase [Actinobacteria bacterium]|nr:MAG: adenylate kinase [Actinomycetota bacterium]